MYLLKKEQREELRKPLGKVVREIKKSEIEGMIISVGDVVTRWLKEHEINPDISIIDYRIERKKHEWKIGNDEKVLKVKNPPGMITDELWNAIKKAYEMKGRIRIEVEGEEDLAALPTILMAPAGANVIYGLPSHGMVVVKVGEKEKEVVRKFIEKMERD